MTGYYNLPQKDKDNYNREPTPEELRQAWIQNQRRTLKRVTKTTASYPGEFLDIYLDRLLENAKELEQQIISEHIEGVKGPWYLHKRPANCWACDSITMHNQLISLLLQLKTLKVTTKLQFGHDNQLVKSTRTQSK